MPLGPQMANEFLRSIIARGLTVTLHRSNPGASPVLGVATWDLTSTMVTTRANGIYLLRESEEVTTGQTTRVAYYSVLSGGRLVVSHALERSFQIGPLTPIRIAANTLLFGFEDAA